MFAVLIRLSALLGLWLAARRTRSDVVDSGRIKRLSMGQKASFLWGIVKDRHTPVWVKALAAVPAVYLASPIDLLPDFIPFVGRLDDAVVFALTVNLIVRFSPASVVQDSLRMAAQGSRSSRMKGEATA